MDSYVPILNDHRMHTCAKKKEEEEKRNKNGRCIKVKILPSFSSSIHLFGSQSIYSIIIAERECRTLCE